MPVILEDFERRYGGLMDVCDLVRSARLLIAQMKCRDEPGVRASAAERSLTITT
jgi:hypothetical protein